MKKNVVVMTIIGMMLLSSFVITPALGSSGGNTIYVDDDSTYPGNGTLLWPYRYIWQSIENASAGDTIYVFNGTYHENVIVNKSISLIGEDRDITIIDGGGSGHVIDITVDYVDISGFTIQNSGSGISNWDNAGINVSSDYNKLSGNNITDNNCGIFLNHSSNTIISRNAIIDNYYYGIVLNDSSNNNISENTIITEYDGLALVISSNNSIVGNTIKNNAIGLDVVFYSCDNIIAGNNITENGYIGIELCHSSDKNIISENNIVGNGLAALMGYGIIIYDLSDNNTIYHNNFVDNKNNTYDSCDNFWDNGYEGNYWDDYTEEDNNGDRIGDIPYDNISGGENNDTYPLMYPWGEIPPVADFTYVVDGLKVTFDASSSYDRDGTIESYYWEFGDGENSTEANPEHTYAEECKTYKVTLNITDNMGLHNETSKDVTTGDTTKPIIEIVKPKRALYIRNQKIRSLLFRMAFIIGDITIEVNASDEGSGMEKVEFYAGLLGTKYLGNDTTEPYSFNWTRDRIRFFHIQILTVKAYDKAGNVAVKRMIVRKLL